MLAHRFIYEAYVGPIPVGHNVCHRCDNPSCVRPEHLFLGSQRENVADMDRKGRRRSSQRSQSGTMNNHAKLTEESVREIRHRLLAGDLHRVIAETYGVRPSAISNIARGKTWSHVT